MISDSLKKPTKVLVADDSVAIRTLLSHTLSNWGYDVTSCANGNEVWKLLRQDNTLQILLLDWVMPGYSGIELCSKIRAINDNKYRYIIMITSNSSTSDIIKGLETGADDYLIKPVSINELKARINAAKRIFNYENELLTKEADVRLACYKTLTELAEARDMETSSHLLRIANMSSAICRIAGYDKTLCQNIETFAPLHDIGKVGIPDGILHLPRKLKPDEFSIMKTHASIGWEILKDKETLEIAAEIAYTHHEKWDGSGYPRGLKEEEIPLCGRIVAIADVYDAMRSVRPYKTSYSHEASVNWIVNASGKSFDPELIIAFKKAENELRNIFDSQYDPDAVKMMFSQRGLDEY